MTRTARARLTANFWKFWAGQTNSAASVTGPLLAGLSLAIIPLPTVFLIDALTFAVSAFTLLSIPISFNALTAEQPRTSISRDVVTGLRYVWNHPVLRTISLFMIVANFFEVSAYAQIVFLAKRQWQATDPEIGLLYAIGSAGTIALSLLASPLRARFPFSKVLITAWTLEGCMIVLLAFTPTYRLGVVVWGVLNGVAVLFNINTGSLRQAIVPNEMLGRVRGVSGFLAFAIMPLGALLGGVMISRLGNATLVYILAGAANVILPLAALLTPLGRAERYLPAARPD